MLHLLARSVPGSTASELDSSDCTQTSKSATRRPTARVTAWRRPRTIKSASINAKRSVRLDPLHLLAQPDRSDDDQIARASQIQAHYQAKQSRQLEAQKREHAAEVSGIMALGLARREREDKEAKEAKEHGGSEGGEKDNGKQEGGDKGGDDE